MALQPVGMVRRNMTTLEKAKIAEDRAFKKYGGTKHWYYRGTIPDLTRVRNGVFELIEVKYFDLGAYYSFQEKAYRIRQQLENRKRCFEDFEYPIKQRLYILFINAKKRGVTAKAIREAVFEELADLDIKIDIDVCKGLAESEDYAGGEM